MKRLLAMAVLVITGCTSSHHSFMDKASVGTVNGHTLVMFDAGVRNGVKYYRPQFASDCGKVYSYQYSDDNSSTTCFIRESRISDLHSYNEHMAR